MKKEFMENVINFVTSGECGYEGLKFLFKDSPTVLYFNKVSENRSYNKVVAEMFVKIEDLNGRKIVVFQYVVPGEIRKSKIVVAEQFTK